MRAIWTEPDPLKSEIPFSGKQVRNGGSCSGGGLPDEPGVLPSKMTKATAMAMLVARMPGEAP
jgi:hypothetical protein